MKAGRVGLLFAFAAGGATFVVARRASRSGMTAWFVSRWPWAQAMIGSVLGVLVSSIWSGASDRLHLAKLTVKEPTFGGVELAVSPAEHILLWRMFVELATRVALQPFPPGEGELGRALGSLYPPSDATN